MPERDGQASHNEASRPSLVQRLLAPALDPLRDEMQLIRASVDRSDYWSARQMEATIALYATLGIAIPLPAMRKGAASPDFLAELVRVIAGVRPASVLELGAGVSTIVTAYALERFGGGSLTTLEHDPEWVDRVVDYVAEHRLAHRVRVCSCPLVPLCLDDRDYEWYDTSALQVPARSVDLLVIDGPPAWGSHDPMSRYPALPMLADLLADNALVVQDDANREGERQGLWLWNQKYGPLEVERPDTEKGMTLIRWAGGRQSTE